MRTGRLRNWSSLRCRPEQIITRSVLTNVELVMSTLVVRFSALNSVTPPSTSRYTRSTSVGTHEDDIS
jgi:hypothetical protein